MSSMSGNATVSSILDATYAVRMQRSQQQRLSLCAQIDSTAVEWTTGGSGWLHWPCRAAAQGRGRRAFACMPPVCGLRWDSKRLSWKHSDLRPMAGE